MPTYRVTWQCASGDHLMVEVTEDDGRVHEVGMMLDDLKRAAPEVKPAEGLRALVEASGKTVEEAISDIKVVKPVDGKGR